MSRTDTKKRSRRQPDPSPVAAEPPAPGSSRIVAWSTAAGGSAGYVLAWAAAPEWNHLGLATGLTRSDRLAFAAIVALGALLGAILGAVLRWRLPSPAGQVPWVRWLRPLALAGALPFLGDHQVWAEYPALALSLALGVVWLAARGTALARAFRADAVPARAAAAGVWLSILAYCVALGWIAVRQHQMLETRAFDLAIMENVLWNTCHGDWFSSALENGSHLGVHTSFVFVLLLPAYCLVPRAETLLVAQALLLGSAAWPLYLLARRMLGSAWQAAVIALAYLVHPAIAGANLYDFHELAFAPLLFFALAWALAAERLRAFWTFLALLLLVKEDMSLLVVSLGVYLMVVGRRLGGSVTVVGLAAYGLLQHLAIPYFAGGEHAYTWYYSDMIPAGEGPAGVLVTMLISPIQSLGYFLQPQKVGYLLQILAPLAMLAVRSGPAIVLLGYGTLLSLAASREPLFQLGYQYSLPFIAVVFFATLVRLGHQDASQAEAARRRSVAIAAIALLSVLGWYHYGLGPPGNAFRSGFRQPRLSFTSADRERYAEVLAMAASIPAEASLTASEMLAPHVSQRRRLQTLRYAASGFGRDYDYYFVLHQEVDDEVKRQLPEVFDSSAYALLETGKYAAIYRRR